MTPRKGTIIRVARLSVASTNSQLSLNISTNSDSDKTACCSERTAMIFDARLFASSQAEVRTSERSSEASACVAGATAVESGTARDIRRGDSGLVGMSWYSTEEFC